MLFLCCIPLLLHILTLLLGNKENSQLDDNFRLTVLNWFESFKIEIGVFKNMTIYYSLAYSLNFLMFNKRSEHLLISNWNSFSYRRRIVHKWRIWILICSKRMCDLEMFGNWFNFYWRFHQNISKFITLLKWKVQLSWNLIFSMNLLLWIIDNYS